MKWTVRFRVRCIVSVLQFPKVLCGLLRTIMDNCGQTSSTLANLIEPFRHLADNTDMEKEFLSADEAAAMLNMHARTVRRLLAAGKLPGTRLGRQWRISAAGVRKLVEGGEKPAKAE